MISLFSFTLGVHLEKRVSNRMSNPHEPGVSAVATVADPIPNRLEFSEQAKNEEQILADILNQEIHDEVTHTGIKLDIPRQIFLPEKTKTSQAGATSPHPFEPKREAAPKSDPETQPKDRPKALTDTPKNTSKEKYTLQIGAYPTKEEVNKQLATLNPSQLKPFWKKADLKNKGKWYRLYVGRFSSRNAAEQAGEKYRSQHMITSFIVSKIFD